MVKQTRHQSVINRQSDAGDSEDHWLKEFENKLQKNSVQPRGISLYDQITSIMNTKSKYTSVQAAVDDMMHRSGLSNYLDQVKHSEQNNQATKVAQNHNVNDNTPEVIKERPGIAKTLENIIKEGKGNMSIPAILARLQSLHSQDISNSVFWEDEKLIHLISKMNLQAKQDNPANYDNFDQLGQRDHGMVDLDVSNTDAWHALMPAKI